MSIHLKRNDLNNLQQLAVGVNGPDGATHLILCTGIANLRTVCHEIYTFLVGPQISRRQFVGVVASGALSTIQGYEKDSAGDAVRVVWAANLVSIDANYDDETGQVKVRAEIESSNSMMKLAISYNVSILAELPDF